MDAALDQIYNHLLEEISVVPVKLFLKHVGTDYQLITDPFMTQVSPFKADLGEFSGLINTCHFRSLSSP